MSNALLIHGWNTKNEYYDPNRPTPSNDHWFPWLTKQLVLNDINTISIEMPDSYYPEYAIWRRELERYDITEETILVGHSCGAGFLVRWLSETDKKVGKVVLVAPWLGIMPEDLDEPFDDSFFDFTIDPQIAGRTKDLVIFHSTDDNDMIQQSVARLRNELEDYTYREFTDKRHFTRKSLGGEDLSELLEEILEKNV